MLRTIIHDIKETPYTVSQYEEFTSTRGGSYSSTGLSQYEEFTSTSGRSYSSTGLSQYEEFSYGFFSVICLAVALMVHINNYPLWYIQKTDYIIEILDSIMLSLKLIKEDTYLPLYTPLNTIKNANNKHITINIPSLKFTKQIDTNTVEDV